MVAVANREQEKLTASVHERIPFARQLGIEAIECSPSRVRARLHWTGELCTDAGALHGGALMALADVCGGICAGLNLPAGSLGTTTIESKTNFLRPVLAGHVDAVSEPLHVGRTTIVVQTDLFDPSGRRAARVTQTQTVLQRGERSRPSAEGQQ